MVNLAVDIGCGSGQSTAPLAPYCKAIVGIDNSPSQIQQAQLSNTNSNIQYRVGYAEQMDLADGSVQLVTAGQCAHWLDLDKFYREVARVLQPSGVLAIYGYHLPQPYHNGVSLSYIVDKLFSGVFGDYIPPESKSVYIDNYRTDKFCTFPFSTLPPIREEFETILNGTSVSALVGYARSWSTFQNFQEKKGLKEAEQVMDLFQNELMEAIGSKETPDDTQLNIVYRYFLLMGLKN